jgi:predicted PolB exonuclease-like 3'-5' exonuclease
VSEREVSFLAFDVESVADGDLVSRIRYPGAGLSADEAIARYRVELMEKYESDFIPYTFQIPISLAVAKIGHDYSLIDLVSLDEPEHRPHVITENFWRGWERYRRPTLVSFNGRTFDIPLMELAAFRYGISIPGWFALESKSFEQPRHRYRLESHFDLHEVLTNFGSARFTGGLNLAANLLGKPGKMTLHGSDVQDRFQAGDTQQIHDYCRCDVLDTYFVFLRTAALVGWIDLSREQELVRQAKIWIEERAQSHEAFARYLTKWGDWPNPWSSREETASETKNAS